MGLELLFGNDLASSHQGAAIGLFYAGTGDFGGCRGEPGLLGSAESLDAPGTGEERIPPMPRQGGSGNGCSRKLNEGQ